MSRNIYVSFIIMCLMFSCCWATIYGQVVSHITNYNHRNYKAGVQNWGIDISSDKFLYAGNSNGLLVYNGNDWSLLEPNGRNTVRAVHCTHDRIYTAGNHNIGYWVKKTSGEMVYTSLMPLVAALGLSADTFWSIESVGHYVYFQAFSSVICYDGRQMYNLTKQGCYSPLFKAGDRLFCHKLGESLMQIEGRSISDFSRATQLAKEEVKFVFQLSHDRLLIGNTNGAIYTLADKELTLLVQLKDDNGIPVRIDCATIWKDELIAIGTIGNGLFLLDMATKRLEHINSHHLQDINVHSLCFADKDFLWLSLDNGISSVVLNPQVYLWKSNSDIGTLFDASYFNHKTYVASNQGTFVFDNDGEKLQTPFFPLSFYNIKNELLCGTTTGLYKMALGDSGFKQVCDINGISKFEYISEMGNEYIFMQAYYGIGLLHYINNTWQYLSTIDNTGTYISIMPENSHTIWALHSDTGIYRLRIDESLSSVVSSDNFTELDGISKYEDIYLVKIEGRVLFITPKGVYLYDLNEKSFKRQENLSRQIGNLDKLQYVKPAYNNNIWVAADNQLFLYRITDLSAELVSHLLFVKNEFTLYDNKLNITSVNDSIVFIPTFDGTYIVNHNALNRDNRQQHGKLRLECISYLKPNASQIYYVDYSSEDIELPNTARNININFSSGLQTYPTSISFRMIGVHDQWSQWQGSGNIQFANLSYGHYTLQVKDSADNLISIPITVTPPFYMRPLMIMLYILILVTGTIALVSSFNARKRKMLVLKFEQKSRAQLDLMQQQAYEQLQQKAVDQEKELKERMRFLSQKQELLNTILAEIEEQKRQLGDRYPNSLYNKLRKIIEEGTTEKDKFLSLEIYFVEAHHQFMLYMQKLHPALSASELKFCCLIRANLSTKEIAVIMGIAQRSVDLKKYRLKQSLNLSQEQSLMSYILSIDTN